LEIFIYSNGKALEWIRKGSHLRLITFGQTEELIGNSQSTLLFS
jgi:hypothetical protein